MGDFNSILDFPPAPKPDPPGRRCKDKATGAGLRGEEIFNLVPGLKLSREEKADLVAFLLCLQGASASISCRFISADIDHGAGACGKYPLNNSIAAAMAAEGLNERPFRHFAALPAARD